MIESAAVKSARRARRLIRKAVEPTTVLVRPAPRGRVTGWSLSCPDHGAMPVLAPGQDAGVLAARSHLEQLHEGKGTIRILLPKRGKRARG